MKNWIAKNSLPILTIFLLIINIVIYEAFWVFLQNYQIIWLILISFEIIVIYLFIRTNITNPIFALKKEIADFLSGWKKWQQIKIVSSDPYVLFIINFFNRSLEILKNFKEELHSGKELKSEVQLASEIQKNTLTKNLPTIPSIDIIWNTKSATEVWWDSYDVIQQWDNFYIYLWDVTWHWVASWFVMMMVNALISGFSKKLVNSSEIIAHTNEILKPRVPSNMLMTLLMVRWNEAEKKMYMTWAWHEYLLVYKASQKKTFQIKSWWIALWMTKNISKLVKESQIWIEKWDVIIMYTDWITEARNTNKEDWMMFTVERLMDTIEKAYIKTAQWIYNEITIELSKWMWYNHKQFDDITLLVMHYRGGEVIENDAIAVLPPENITEWNWS